MNQRMLRMLVIVLLAVAGFGSTSGRKGHDLVPASPLELLGVIPFSGVRVVSDRAHGEVYVADQNIIRIFNDAGMEIYWFGYDASLGAIRDLAVDEAGDVFILGLDVSDPVKGPSFFVSRCDYRGEPKRSSFSRVCRSRSPDSCRIACSADGKFLLVSTIQMLAVRADAAGVFERGYDLAR